MSLTQKQINLLLFQEQFSSLILFGQKLNLPKIVSDGIFTVYRLIQKEINLKEEKNLLEANENKAIDSIGKRLFGKTGEHFLSGDEFILFNFPLEKQVRLISVDQNFDDNDCNLRFARIVTIQKSGRINIPDGILPNYCNYSVFYVSKTKTFIVEYS
jgi:hypothetical protein